MEKTRTKFKIVSDPFAPEEKWLPACHSTDEGSAAIACDIWSSEDRSKPSDRLKRFAGLLVLSVTLAVSGGIIAGQSIHTMYYAYHVVCISAGQWGFEPWGSFYHWYNQAPALNCYMPVLFSYFAAYILTFHGSGKTSLWVWLTVMGCYYLWLWFHPQDTFSSYAQVWLASGVIASALAFWLGNKVSSSLKRTISPQKLLIPLIPLMVSMAFLFCLPNVLDSFPSVLLACLFFPFFAGYHVASLFKTSSAGVAAGLALSACSPFVLAGLLHIPATLWFALNIWINESMDPLAVGRALVYLFAIPVVVLLGSAFGGYCGYKHNKGALYCRT